MCIKDFTDSIFPNILNLCPSFSIQPSRPHQLFGHKRFKLQGQIKFKYQLIHSPLLINLNMCFGLNSLTKALNCFGQRKVLSCPHSTYLPNVFAHRNPHAAAQSARVHAAKSMKQICKQRSATAGRNTNQPEAKPRGAHYRHARSQPLKPLQRCNTTIIPPLRPVYSVFRNIFWVTSGGMCLLSTSGWPGTVKDRSRIYALGISGPVHIFTTYLSLCLAILTWMTNTSPHWSPRRYFWTHCTQGA